MAFDFALFITHPDPEYIVFSKDFINSELATTGYNSAYMETCTELGNELAQQVALGNTAGELTIHEDPNVVTTERHWISIDACRAWMDIVVRVHTATDCPLPLEAKVVNLITLVETVIYPT